MSINICICQNQSDMAASGQPLVFIFYLNYVRIVTLEKRKFSVKYRNLLDLGSGGLRCLALSTSTLICSRSSCTRMLTLPKGNSCIAFCSRCLSHKYLPTRTLLSEAYNCNWASILSKVSSLGDLPA